MSCIVEIYLRVNVLHAYQDPKPSELPSLMPVLSGSTMQQWSTTPKLTLNIAVRMGQVNLQDCSPRNNQAYPERTFGVLPYISDEYDELNIGAVVSGKKEDSTCP